MSFLRHKQIYQSDEMVFIAGSGPLLQPRPRPHRLDESAAGYSLAGCSPALPASASPAGAIILWFRAKTKAFAANGNLSLISLSHLRGALPLTVSLLGFTPIWGKIPL